MTNRIVSASIGLPILLAAVWIGSPWFSAFVFIVAIIAALELTRLAGLWGDKFHFAIPVILSALFIAGVQGWVVNDEIPLTPYYHFAAIAVFALVARRLSISRNEARPYPAFGIALATSLYVGGLLSYALLLRDLEQGMEWTLLLLIAVFATDTTAFFIGRAIGRTPLAPSVSPNKTREGAIAGLVGAVFASVLAVNLLDIDAIIWEALILGLIIGTFAQFGDLVESSMKRKAGVKDSGILMPGHGGILDRIDSIVFTLPAVYYFVIWEVQQKGLLS